MNAPREYWPRWAESLRRYQLNEMIALFLEAGSPLALFGAQAIYFSGGTGKSGQLAALAHLLEDENELQAFASYLSQDGDKR